MRAKLTFINYKISQEEIDIQFLSWLEKRVKKARTVDIRISDRVMCILYSTQY